jgi:hypothetical protein
MHDESSFNITAAPGIKAPDDMVIIFDRSTQGTQACCGGSWWTKLVHRIQGAHWAFSSIVRSLRYLGDTSRGRLCLSRPTSVAGPVRLPDLQPLSVLRLLSRFARFQTTAGILHYLDMRDLGIRDFEADSLYFEAV